MFPFQELFFQVLLSRYSIENVFYFPELLPSSGRVWLPCCRSLLGSLPSGPRELPRPTPAGKANNPIFNKSPLRNLSSESAFLVLCISSYLRDAQPWNADRLNDAGWKIIRVEITKIHSDTGVHWMLECFRVFFFFKFFIPQAGFNSTE